VIEQGVEMERPSRMEVTVAARDSATVRGRARKLLSGPLELRAAMPGSADREKVAASASERLQALVGRELPQLELDSTNGPVDLHELAAARLVLFIYPHATGLPEPPVPDWDLIPGARGCTAQSCGFRDHYQRLYQLGAETAGLSAQEVAEQRQFAARAGLAYRLISDPKFKLAAALKLPTFVASGRPFYRRLAVVVEGSVIVKVFDPVDAPAENAAEIVGWLESRVAGEEGTS
jgi:peroxiredoxin